MAYSFKEEPIANAYIRYETPVSSFRPHEAFLLIGGGDADAMSFEDKRHYRAIQTWVEKAYPEQNRFLAKRKASPWWGEDVDSVDMLPLIGAYRQGSKRIFMATGYCGWGMAKAAFAGTMLAALVSGEPSPYQVAFDPWRF